jgi:hypothetical protein
MVLRILPYILIIVPIVGFFYTPDPPPSSMDSDGRQAIADLAYMLFTIPWWGKLLSIFVGLALITSNRQSEEKDE